VAATTTNLPWFFVNFEIGLLVVLKVAFTPRLRNFAQTDVARFRARLFEFWRSPSVIVPLQVIEIFEA
jgi:hypothetical protein